MANRIETAMAMLKGSGATSKLPAMFPWPVDSFQIPEKGYGLGNPLSTMAKNLAQPFREQIGYFIFRRDAITGDLVLPGSSSAAYFQTGEGEPPPASFALASFRQNLATTNLFSKGAPTSRDNLFAMLALGVQIGRPFGIKRDESGGYEPKRLFCPWTDSYGQRARDLLWTSLGSQVVYRDAACSFEMGNISNYVPAGGQTGGETVRANGGFGVLSMLPINRGPVYLGANDEQNQATILFTSVEEDIVLCNDSLAKTVDDLAVPVHAIAYGDFGPWCGPCAPSAEDIDAIVRKRVDAAMMAAGLAK